MLNEIKIKSIAKLIITDRDNDICNMLKIANNIVKRNLFINKEDPKEYSITIYCINNIDRWKESLILTNKSKQYNFEFIFSDIDNDGLEYKGNLRIDELGYLMEWNLYKDSDTPKNEYSGPICVNLANNDFSLDIRNNTNDISVNDGMLKFNDANAKISVIRDLKTKFDKESDKDESGKNKS